VEGLPQGKSIDLTQAMPLIGADVKIEGTNDYRDTADADIVVITAGLPRKPGMSREDLLIANCEIVKEVVEKSLAASPSAIFIVLTNPLDAMAYLVMKVGGLPPRRVIGQAGVLDSGRMSAFVGMELDVSIQNVHCYVLGGHGDDMVPLVRHSNVAGIPLNTILPAQRLEAIVERTREAGGEVVRLLKSASAFYAPAAALVKMVDAVLRDRHLIVPASVYLDGQYGIRGIFFGVPAQLGREGVEKIIEYDLNHDEIKALERSAARVHQLIESLAI
jgi:malate dehydrogenase